MVGLVPSILSADFTRLGEQVREAEAAGAQRIQIDVMDGHFVPNITMGPMVVEAVRRCTTLPLEAHLMISNPQEYIETFAKAGADVIIVHQEVCPHLHRVLKQIKATGKQAGVALNPSTPVILLQDMFHFIDLLLIMTINPGFGGQEFIPETLPKITQARQIINHRGLHCDIEVDGGVNAQTIPQMLHAGANLFVAGSAVYNNKETVQEAMDKLRLAASVKL
ncbi:ribulose-phosphate 3-epimerase [Tengunoibacter tsumagoiensis]|uniref:Ribulose-phosphate 3-epimerase n=1 Tax=Tengunoibacter tsumagoiensis TaxID=2014871 RepID=A0A402A2R0_9CHLR|nr:ribulose-phosphate 3-epimerase [Tengunoibacter tsumagoiensis]GCE13427.1 ribulose-phosphate 3-epimerase [Tengunoibacter tsumagoiensis]